MCSSCAPALAAGADGSLLWKLRECYSVAGYQHVADRATLRHSANDESGDRLGRQVLQAVHGQIDLAGEQAALELFGKQSVAADRADRLRLLAIAARRDQHDVDVVSGFAQPHRYRIRLPTGQDARTGADSYGT